MAVAVAAATVATAARDDRAWRRPRRRLGGLQSREDASGVLRPPPASAPSCTLAAVRLADGGWSFDFARCLSGEGMRRVVSRGTEGCIYPGSCGPHPTRLALTCKKTHPGGRRKLLATCCSSCYVESSHRGPRKRATFPLGSYLSNVIQSSFRKTGR